MKYGRGIISAALFLSLPMSAMVNETDFGSTATEPVLGQLSSIESSSESHRGYRFAIQIGFFKDKKSVWRFIANEALSEDELRTVKVQGGYALLFGRYQSFEMAEIVLEQLQLDNRDSFIVNLP